MKRAHAKTGQNALYLSVIRDLYDNSIIAYRTGTEQNINLVFSTIKATRKKEKVTAERLLRSDQGFQYPPQAYYILTKSYHTYKFHSNEHIQLKTKLTSLKKNDVSSLLNFNNVDYRM